MKTEAKYYSQESLIGRPHFFEGRPQKCAPTTLDEIDLSYNLAKYFEIKTRKNVGAYSCIRLSNILSFFKTTNVLTLFIFLFFGFSSQAQSLTDAATLKMTAQSDTVNIAEPFEAILELNLSAGTRFDSSQEVCAFDTSFDVATSFWETKDGFKWQNKLRITPWDTGKIKIVPQAKVKTDNDSQFRIISDSFFINARYPTEIDSMKQIMPIKDIIKEPTYFLDYILQYALPVLIALSIGGLFWYLFRRYKRNKENKKNYRGPYISPYMKAIKNIEALKIPLLMPEVDDFFNKVSKEVRQALYDAENIFTLHKTTTETVTQLQLKKFTPTQIETLQQILSSADMVKFAQMQPPQTICSDFKNTVIALLRELENNKK